jgi:rhomboid family protein
MPIFTIYLIAANFFAYDVELFNGGQAFCEAHGLVPAHLEVSSIFSSFFLHDPAGWLHIGGNMIFLAVFGTIVEREIGHLRFLALYLAAGVGGALMHILVNPTSGDTLVGASGAIFGLMAVAGVLRPRLLGFVAAFVGLNIWYALAGTGGAVSFGDHLGGFAVGAMFVVVAMASGRLEAA